jgi:hypothetical protein
MVDPVQMAVHGSRHPADRNEVTVAPIVSAV